MPDFLPLLSATDQGHVLLRSGLLARLLEAEDARLVLVRAPAGFGKTTLLRQYREQRLACGRALLWLDMGTLDNDLARLLGELDASLPLLDDGELSSHALLERIALHPGPLDIVLDEFEEVQAPALLRFVQQLLDMLPADSRLILASQTTPDIGIARIRARGQLLELTPRALRFSLEETACFLREQSGLSLDDAQVGALQRCTEGWGVALALAAMSLQGRPNPQAFIDSFAEVDADLAAYLAEAVVARLTDDQRRFILRTSLLDSFCAPLCDELFVRDDSQEHIDFLVRGHLFIYPRDNQGVWFRYHRLFARHLCATFTRQAPEEVQALRQRAAEWYFAHGQPAQGIDQLLLAGDAELAAGRIAEHLQGLFEAGRTRRMLRWLEQLPAEVRERHGLAFAYGWAALFNRRYAETRQVVERRAGELDGEALRLIMLAVLDQVEDACQVGRALLGRLPRDGSFASLAVANTLAYSLLSCGHYDEARALLSASRHADSARQPGAMSTVAVNAESIIDLLNGRFGSAAARLEGFRQQRFSSDARVFAAKVPLELLYALVLYERNDVEEAQRLLGENLSFAMDSGPLDVLILACILLARLAALRGERQEWSKYLAELERLGRETGSPRILSAVWVERARLATLEGRLDAATQAVQQAERHAGWERRGVIFLGSDDSTPAIARLRLRIAQGQFSAACESLKAALDEAEKYRHRRRALKLRQLLALAADGLGRGDEAFAQLTRALHFAADERLLRSFLDEGPTMAALLQRWALKYQPRASALGIAPGFLAELLKHFAEQGEVAAVEPQEQLSARELEVLRWSARGLPIREIAEGMALSEHTVKTHLRNINAKLGAHGRTEAAAIARARGLIA